MSEEQLLARIYTRGLEVTSDHGRPSRRVKEKRKGERVSNPSQHRDDWFTSRHRYLGNADVTGIGGSTQYRASPGVIYPLVEHAARMRVPF